MNAQQVMPRWSTYFKKPSSSQLGLVNAIFFVGKVVGLPVVTVVCDRFGRRLPILLGLCLCLAGTAVQSSAVSFDMLVFSRASIGFSTAFMSQPSPLLIAEVSYPTHRGKITALYQTFYVSLSSARFADSTDLIQSYLTVFRCHSCRLDRLCDGKNGK